MLKQNADLDLLRYLINLIESERNERVYLKNKVNEIENKLDFQSSKFQDFKYQLKDLEGEVAEVRINNQVLSEKNAELENLQHPDSMDGKPICDYWEND